jgi:hypothetical protein
MGDWLFEPVEFDEMGNKTWDYFQQYTHDMRRLGFEPIRDYRLRHYPGPVFARFFLSRDGRTFGDISDYLGQRSYSFFSIFDDGIYLETTSLRTRHSPPQTDQLVIHLHADLPVDELYARHLEHMCVHAEHVPCSAIELTPQDVDEAANYGRRLVHSVALWGRWVPPPDFVRRAAARSGRCAAV